uniref:Uncharacterized protein n=1 Tax=Siphoviridae sp. ctq8D8 TaxID=2827944 RepID=A0A8S5SMN0_9CAUD|nr:MAG TPA: hypothetical protein [Siphoviridae sp. ctq8D8]
MPRSPILEVVSTSHGNSQNVGCTHHRYGDSRSR